jgi:hypothetical protein
MGSKFPIPHIKYDQKPRPIGHSAVSDPTVHDGNEDPDMLSSNRVQISYSVRRTRHPCLVGVGNGAPLHTTGGGFRV